MKETEFCEYDKNRTTAEIKLLYFSFFEPYLSIFPFIIILHFLDISNKIVIRPFSINFGKYVETEISCYNVV